MYLLITNVSRVDNKWNKYEENKVFVTDIKMINHFERW